MKIPCDAIQNNTCGIYIIRNLVNNKIYIGQSVDIKRRWQEHLRSGQPEKYNKKSLRDANTPIHRAMQKYGVNNFSIQILEVCSKENLNSKEKYWIKIFNATNKNFGYNITNGGQDNFALSHEQHSQAKLSQKQVNEIIELLRNSNLSLSEISKKYSNISKATLSMINQGKTWKNKNLIYPIRQTYKGSKGSKNPRARFTEEEVMELRKMYSQGLTLKNIPEKYKKIASDSAITAIFYGKTYKHLPIWDKKEKKWIEPCIDYSRG